MASVGDMMNNLRILQSESRQMKYSEDFDLEGLARGNPQSLLPLYNHLFTSYNPLFSEEVMNFLGDGLCMKSDVRFMESVYKILRDMFHFRPTLTKEQFFTMNNFAERKIIMACEVMRQVRDRCRYLGPKHPTNPNIKVQSVVQSGRINKKISAHELVTSEPNLEAVLSRKVSDKSRKPVPALMGMNKKEGWQLKAGYLRPKSAIGGAEEPAKKGLKYNDIAVRGLAQRVSNNASKEDNVCDLTESQVKAVEIPQGRRSSDSGHMRVSDVTTKSSDHSDNDWDPSEAVECILSKVRDLPTQLTSFMKAVEDRLQRIEDRLETVESFFVSFSHPEGRNTQDELKHEVDMLQARLLLLENRVALNQSKAFVNPMPSEQPRKTVEEKNLDYSSASPFVALERGGNAITRSISPISGRLPRDQGFSNISANNSIASVADEETYQSSTPKYLADMSFSGNAYNTKIDQTRTLNCDTSAIFNTLDSTTRQQVERIQGLLRATQLLLPNGTG